MFICAHLYYYPSKFAQAAQIFLHELHELALISKIREIRVKGVLVAALPRWVYLWLKSS